MACFCVGTEKARKDLELSSTLFASNAFWLVLTVATQDRVVSEKMTDDGSKVRGRTDAPILARSAPSTAACWALMPGIPFPKSVSMTLLAPRARPEESFFQNRGGSESETPMTIEQWQQPKTKQNKTKVLTI